MQADDTLDLRGRNQYGLSASQRDDSFGPQAKYKFCQVFKQAQQQQPNQKVDELLKYFSVSLRREVRQLRQALKHELKWKKELDQTGIHASGNLNRHEMNLPKYLRTKKTWEGSVFEGLRRRSHM